MTSKLERFTQALTMTIGVVLIGIGFDWPWQAYLGGGMMCGALSSMLSRTNH